MRGFKAILSEDAYAEPFSMCKHRPPPQWVGLCFFTETKEDGGSDWLDALLTVKDVAFFLLIHRIKKKKMDLFYRNMMKKRRSQPGGHFI